MSDALSKMLREVARRLEWQESYVLPEAWAKSRMMLGRRVCITSEDRGTAVSVMEAAASALDTAEAKLAEAQEKLAEAARLLAPLAYELCDDTEEGLRRCDDRDALDVCGLNYGHARDAARFIEALAATATATEGDDPA